MKKIKAPNYTQVPNQILDQMADLGNAELRVLLAITRQTLGWHRDTKKLTIRRMAKLTGLNKSSVVDAIPSLKAKGLIVRGQAGRSFWYELNLDDSETAKDEQDEEVEENEVEVEEVEV